MRTAMIGAALLASGCVFSGSARNGDGDGSGPDAGDSPDAQIEQDAAIDGPGSPERRKTITVSGDVTDETLSDFPLYVALTNDADLKARAQTDGSDIFFLAADDATPLDYEIEKWDPDTGTLIAWVRVDIDAATGVILHLHYGEPASAQPPNPAGVWQNGFLAVFHMNNDPDTPIVDSTGARNGTADASMDATDLVAAKLGDGLALDGMNDVINFDNPFSGDSTHTISGWVSQDASNNNEAFVVLGTGGATDEARFIHTRFDNDTILTGFYNDDVETDDDIQGAGFKLVHWTYDAGHRGRVYLDGSLAFGPSSYNGVADTQGTEGRIGNAPGGGSGFGSNMGLNGIVDEVRIASVVRSDAWIAAEFANQNTPGAFYTLGPEQEVPGPVIGGSRQR